MSERRSRSPPPHTFGVATLRSVSSRSAEEAGQTDGPPAQEQGAGAVMASLPVRDASYPSACPGCTASRRCSSSTVAAGPRLRWSAMQDEATLRRHCGLRRVAGPQARLCTAASRGSSPLVRDYPPGSYGQGGAGNCTRVGGIACSTAGLDGKMLNLGASYALSRRTSLFAIASQMTNGSSGSNQNVRQGVPSPSVGADIRQVALGLNHTF